MMQKNTHRTFGDWMLIILSAALLFAALFLPAHIALAEEWTLEEQHLLEALHSGEIIRLHVIANSDSPHDQTIKLQVRDALIDAFGSLIADYSANSKELFRMLQKNVSVMEQTALLCARNNGFEGKVSAQADILFLPEKRYGKVTLPAGPYRALRVVLGNGEGQNWWCVLFPQLCLSLAETRPTQETQFFWSSRQIFRHWLLMEQ